MLWAALMSLYLLLLWGLLVMGLMGLFWLSVLAVMLPRAIAIARLSSRNLLRPARDAENGSEYDLHAVYLDRGLRAFLVAGAAIFLAYVWEIDLVELINRDTLITRPMWGQVRVPDRTGIGQGRGRASGGRAGSHPGQGKEPEGGE